MYLPELNELAAKIRFTSDSKGFECPNPGNVHQKMLLSIGEISEADEQLRDGHGVLEIYYAENSDKPEGFPVEIADAIIRLLDLSSGLGIDIATVIDLKMRYNATRPSKHGRKY